MDKVWEALKM